MEALIVFLPLIGALVAGFAGRAIGGHNVMHSLRVVVLFLCALAHSAPSPLLLLLASLRYCFSSDNNTNYSPRRSDASAEHQAIADAVPNAGSRIADITVENVTARDATLVGAAVLGLPEAHVTGVILRRFSVGFREDATPDIPLMAEGVPAMLHIPLFSECAEIAGDIDILPAVKEIAPC